MQIKSIIDALERVAPLALQESWDNSGLQVGHLSGDCSAMVVALDPTEAVVDLAIARGAGLIITHHPLLFKGLQTIDTDTSIGRVVEKLLCHNITLYALHTPADSAIGGLNERMIRALGIEKSEPIEPSPTNPLCGMGRIGTLSQPVAIDRFVAQTAPIFRLPASVAYATPIEGKQIARVAVCSGSGASMIGAAALAGADVLVCGDVKHHNFQEALERNIAIIDATHYATEIGFVDWIEELLSDIQKKNSTFALHLFRNNFISYYTR